MINFDHHFLMKGENVNMPRGTAPTFFGKFWSFGRTIEAEIFRFGGELARDSGLHKFRSYAIFRDVSRRELFTKIISMSIVHVNSFLKYTSSVATP